MVRSFHNYNIPAPPEMWFLETLVDDIALFLSFANFFLKNDVCTVVDVSAGISSKTSFLHLAKFGLEVWSFGPERVNSFKEGLKALESFVPKEGTWIIDRGITSYPSVDDITGFYSTLLPFVEGVVMLWPDLASIKEFRPPRYLNDTIPGTCTVFGEMSSSSGPVLVQDFEESRALRKSYNFISRSLLPSPRAMHSLGKTGLCVFMVRFQESLVYQ